MKQLNRPLTESTVKLHAQFPWEPVKEDKVAINKFEEKTKTVPLSNNRVGLTILSCQKRLFGLLSGDRWYKKWALYKSVLLEVVNNYTAGGEQEPDGQTDGVVLT